MKKFFTSLAILFLVFSGYFQSPVPVYAQPDESLSIQSQGQSQPSIESALSGCNITETFSLCILWLIYHVVLAISTFILALAAKVFDFFISYSLNSNSYTNEFITKGWALIRDLANVMFIFTLLYLAIKHILGGSAKNHIPILIIIALLINFSLFFTKVAIDAGNILARAFYNSMNIENDTSASEYGYKSISVAIVNKINPQQLLSQDFFKPKYTTGDLSSSTGTITQTGDQNMTQNLNDNFWWYAFIFILLAIINFILALTFLSMALLFLGRVIGLWFAMIFSPVAFITLAVPGVGGMVSKLNFNSWKDLVLKQAFLAPIVMFFLYLTVMFLQIMFTTITPQEGQDTFMKIMGILIPFIFIVLILNTAKKVANDMSGEIGKAAKEWGGKAVGFVGGAALGATAFAGRAALGRIASARLGSGNYNARIADATKRYEEAKASGDIAAQASASLRLKRLEMTKSALSKMKDSTWDIRNAGKAGGAIGWMSKQAGAGISTGMQDFGGKSFSFGKGDTQTRKKYEEEKEKEKLKKAEDLEKIGREELAPTLDRMLKRGDDEVNILARIGKDISHLDKSMTGLDTNSPEYKRKKLERDQLNSLMQNVARARGDRSKLSDVIEKGSTIDQNGNIVKVDDKDDTAWKGTTKTIKSKSTERRNLYANRVERDTWYNVTTGENEYTADKIRKGDKVKSEEDKLLDSIKKVVKEKEEKEAKPEEPKPDAGNPPPPTS